MSDLQYIQELIGKAPVLAFAKDVEGRYVYVNDAYLVFCGFEREAVLGSTDYDLFPPEIAEVFVKNDRLVLETGQTIDTEDLAPSRSELRVGHCTKFALRDDSGSITAIGGIVIDITERHAARTALERSEARYRQLVEHSPDAYCVLAPDTGKFIHVNDNACALFKLSREHLLQVGPKDLSPPTQADGRTTEESSRGYIGEALAGQNPVFDWIHIAGDGELLPCRIWLARVDLEFGPGVRASILDLREIERVRSTLERTRAQLDAVQDALPQLVLVFDPIRRSVIHANRTYRLLLGEPPVVELWEVARAACERALSDGTGRQELQLTTALGQHRTIELAVSVFHRDDDGNATRLLLVGSDVTDQRELDAELRQARRLESLGRLAGGVAHDFNNLLTVILGSAEFLEPVLESDETARKDLGALRDAALQAKALTSQLLTFARADEGHAAPLEVDAVVSASLRMLERLLGPNVQSEVRLEAPDRTVLIDAGQLQQIIVNLAVNARDAMPKGGRLVIATRVVQLTPGHGLLGTLAAGEYVELTFEDTGSGMSPEVAEKAFEPFFTTKQRGDGTGLGLSTVFGILQRAKGRVVLESRPERGTTVRLWLPVQGQLTTSQQPPPKVRAASSGARVLLVEDDASVCAVSVRALRAAGYHVTTAETPARALALAEANGTFDLIVSDVVMPAMSGFDLAEKLLARMGSVPILFVSGYAEQALQERGLQGADVELLRKPFSPAELIERVNGLMADAN
ncbi:MAG TPA: PAS domain-containing protein [Polyangiaceae bacterium]